MVFPVCPMCDVRHEPYLSCDDPRFLVNFYEVEDGEAFCIEQKSDEGEDMCLKISRPLALQIAKIIMKTKPQEVHLSYQNLD